VRGEDGFVLGRHEAYIGVLIDDLVTRSMSEPYRLHTSRAEHRLLLRPDSADLRLSEYAYRFGIIDDERYGRVQNKRATIQNMLTNLDGVIFTSSRVAETCAQEIGLEPIGHRLSARELLRRPGVRYVHVAQLAQRIVDERERAASGETVLPASLPNLPEETAEEVETHVKYEVYIQKQEQMVHRTQRLEEMRIPAGIDYQAIIHMRIEARQKLGRTLPRTVGQASRVEGVTPADIAILMIHLERQRGAKASS
jgi:tRNA uridine 5-carboxymethylaminomethyl modification enzyme